MADDNFPNTTPRTGHSRPSLRDYFAAEALQGLLGSEIYMTEIDDTCKKLSATAHEEKIVAAKVVTETAYFIADAMLRARSLNNGN